MINAKLITVNALVLANVDARRGNSELTVNLVSIYMEEI
jgi:hypothetical protein